MLNPIWVVTMARTLEFRFAGQAFKCEIDKVDRSALYGSTEVETRDAQGRRCETATLAADGRTIIPSGGTAIGHFNVEGRWLERGDLMAVDISGHRVNPVASSFDSPIELETKTTPERFLDHSIRLVYALDVVEGAVPAGLASMLDGGGVYKLDFSYRGGSSADPAFMLKGADGALWLLVGDENDVNFVGFTEVAGLMDSTEADAPGDDIDFEMN